MAWMIRANVLLWVSCAANLTFLVLFAKFSFPSSGCIMELAQPGIRGHKGLTATSATSVLDVRDSESTTTSALNMEEGSSTPMPTSSTKEMMEELSLNSGAQQTKAPAAITPVPALTFDEFLRFDLDQAASGIHSADWCRQSCRAQFQCNESQVKICSWNENATCTCRDEWHFPSHWFRVPGKGAPPARETTAVLMAGMVRSFASNLMQEYWQLFFSQLQKSAPATLFAVLSIKSSNKQSLSDAQQGGTAVFDVKKLEELLNSLGVPWRGHFPHETNWKACAALVKDPALAFLLSPPDHLQVNNVGHFNTYRARAVAFDLMLQFEQERKERFTKVLFLRPDMVYDFSILSISSCPDAIFCFNDMFAAMQRKLAPWYATHVATIRTLAGEGFTPNTVPDLTQKMEKLLGWHLNGGWHDQPMLHLARHGIPYFGIRLDVAETDAIPCGNTTFDFWIIRDVESTGPPGANICSGRSNVRDLQMFLQRFGVSDNVSSNLEACKS